MVDLQVSNKQRVFNLYGDTVQLPTDKEYKLNYGDLAYNKETGEGHIYKGEITGWELEYTDPPKFYAEFTMEDTADALKVWGSPGYAIYTDWEAIQYSSDGTNWTDLGNNDVALTGHLKWYLRQKPGVHDCFGIELEYSEILTIDKFDCGRFTQFSNTFYGQTKLKSIDIALDTKRATDFTAMFSQSKVLTHIEPFDTSNGITFYAMFSGCSAITSIPDFNTSKGVNFTYMFVQCFELVSAPSIDTQKGEEFNLTFGHNPKLTCIPKIDTRSAIDTSNMFGNSPAIVRPNASEQTAIMTIPGIEWINDAPCPI